MGTIEYSLHRHAFLRNKGPRHDPAVAKMGDAMTLELFRPRLSEGWT